MAERNLNFDEIVNRKNTDCLKYDFAKRRGMPEDVLPLWVADMDFEIAPAITKRLVKAAQKGAFGYQLLSDDYYQTFIEIL